jgi:hypothetical protein
MIPAVELDALLADVKGMWAAMVDLVRVLPGADAYLATRSELPEVIDTVFEQAKASVSETRPTLPKAPGVGRDSPHAPKGTVMVFFERDLTDDELRNFHDWINGRYPSAPDVLLDSDAPRGKRTRERT